MIWLILLPLSWLITAFCMLTLPDYNIPDRAMLAGRINLFKRR